MWWESNRDEFFAWLKGRLIAVGNGDDVPVDPVNDIEAIFRLYDRGLRRAQVMLQKMLRKVKEAEVEYATDKQRRTNASRSPAPYRSLSSWRTRQRLAINRSGDTS